MHSFFKEIYIRSLSKYIKLSLKLNMESAVRVDFDSVFERLPDC